MYKFIFIWLSLLTILIFIHTCIRGVKVVKMIAVLMERPAFWHSVYCRHEVPNLLENVWGEIAIRKFELKSGFTSGLEVEESVSDSQQRNLLMTSMFGQGDIFSDKFFHVVQWHFITIISFSILIDFEVFAFYVRPKFYLKNRMTDNYSSSCILGARDGRKWLSG